MHITHLLLENIKSYRRASISLAPGTTAIRGHNGAGKSTLVEAIGFALFDALPYSRQLFIREGEKAGRVVVGIISSADGRPYEVERRCVASGGGAWNVVDRELKIQAATGKDDVVAFLRVHLGLETTLPLSELFANAIAVPQGTFTADFLQTASLRRKKFDTLLQVEEYRKAYDDLRETERYLRDRLAAIDADSARLGAQTAELDLWRRERSDVREQRAQLGERIGVISDERAATEAIRTELLARQAEVARCDQERERSHGLWQTSLATAAAATERARRAATASAVCAQAAPDHARHIQAGQDLAQAQTDARRVGELRIQLTRAEESRTAAQQSQSLAAERLRQAEAATEEMARLAPLIARQAEYEEAIRAAEEARRLLTKLEKDHAQHQRHQQQAQADLEAAQRQIADLEPLLPIAAQYQERAQHFDLLQRQQLAAEEQRQRAQKLEATRKRLAPRQESSRLTATAAAERVAATRALAGQLEPLPQQSARVATLDRNIARLKAERQQAEQALHASQGGMCPLLKQRCLNIARDGLTSLEDYFGNEVVRYVDEILPLEDARTAAWNEVQRLTTLQAQVDQLPDLDRAAQAAQAQAATLDEELAATEAELGALRATLAAAPTLAAEVQDAKERREESFIADRKCAALTAQRSAQTNAQERLESIHAQDAACQADMAEARGRAAALPAAQAALRELGNPREQSARFSAIAATGPAIREEMARHAAAHEAAVRQIAAVGQQLAPFADLDARISALQAMVAATAAAHENYLRHEAEAQRLPEAESQAATAEAAATAAAAVHAAAQAAHAAALQSFDPLALAQAQQRLADLDGELATITERLSQARVRIADLDAHITEAEARAQELSALQAERDEVIATQSLLAYARDTIKEAGPFVTRALLRQISGEANRIYGEIIGDRSAQLLWSDEYDIELHMGGHVRTFAQLSGGEQMSAALALRLALLRTLTRSSLAIFDEPTQNMDGERRANLAEQIRRVRGFDQLLVISHDDTFEEGLDAVIAVHKSAGESLVEGDAIMPFMVPMMPLQAVFGGA